MSTDYEQDDLFDLLDEPAPARTFTAYYYAGTFGYRCGWCGTPTNAHGVGAQQTWNGWARSTPGAVCYSICKTCAHVPGQWSAPPQETWRIEGDPEWKP